MKKFLGMLAVLILGASLSFAQTPDNSANSDRGAGTTATQNGGGNNNHSQGSDWGWIGLFGLAGLAGLRGRRQYSTERDRDVTNIRRAA